MSAPVGAIVRTKQGTVMSPCVCTRPDVPSRGVSCWLLRSPRVGTWLLRSPRVGSAGLAPSLRLLSGGSDGAVSGRWLESLALPTLRCIPVPTPNVRRARFPTPHVCCVRNSALRPCAVCSSAVPTCLSCRSFAVRTSAWCPNPRIKIYKSSPRTRARDLGLCTPTHRPLCYGAVERAQNAHASLLTFVLPLGRLVLPLGLCRMPGNRRLDSAGCRGSTFVRGVLLDRTFSAVATFVRFVGTFGKSPPLSACARARCRIFYIKASK